VDLVATVLKMPARPRGRELYSWICDRHPAACRHVVFTMAYARTEEIGALVEESGSAFIQKPV